MRAAGAMLATLLAPWALQAQAVAVSAAAFELSRPLAPGSIAALFGEFPGATLTAAQQIPLPTELAGWRVLVEGEPAGLYAVSATQINFMVPLSAEAAAEARTAEIVVEREGLAVSMAGLLLRDVSPAVFTLDAADALRPAAALNQDNSVNSADNPAQPGEVIQIFGMGPGARPAGSAETVAPPSVWFRTWRVEATASALPPGLPGMWQVNARVPVDADLPEGPSPLVVQTDGLHSNTVTVWLSR